MIVGVEEFVTKRDNVGLNGCTCEVKERGDKRKGTTQMKGKGQETESCCNDYCTGEFAVRVPASICRLVLGQENSQSLK